MNADEIIIPAPSLLPWTDLNLLTCDVCGTRPFTRWERFVNSFRGRLAQYSASYCKGGKAPVEDIASPIEAAMRGVTEVRPSCGGIDRPHLHLKCNICDFTMLMETHNSR